MHDVQCAWCGDRWQDSHPDSPSAVIWCGKCSRDVSPLEHLLGHVSQLLDGWHNDGTAWSKWDEQVRIRVSNFQAAFSGLKKPNLLSKYGAHRLICDAQHLQHFGVTQETKNALEDRLAELITWAGFAWLGTTIGEPVDA